MEGITKIKKTNLFTSKIIPLKMFNKYHNIFLTLLNVIAYQVLDSLDLIKFENDFGDGQPGLV